jgi:hypothetical protein
MASVKPFPAHPHLHLQFQPMVGANQPSVLPQIEYWRIFLIMWRHHISDGNKRQHGQDINRIFQISKNQANQT